MVNIAAIIYEPGNSVRNKTGGWRTFRPILDIKKCIKCEKCYIFCPEGAIQEDIDGNFIIDYDYCKGCLICEHECPVKAITRVREEK
ncbi:pyruvate ferredoxin/flavodoxin oxidoreductase subunit delta [Methanocaldococcus villosus KIN24-T80]|uniref:Pyruvate synthase subunit PorD n=1 Tax=Methanocaldococcus villosus KIN24-T80 TaxID=1069083 RepID=N6VRI3_9EURY|nr:pyruvate synthase subunit PorD [Methanocaldococcus villosus]ENN96495.1 pyruvate ferredoxin/flavodoxin oxidoreductase subunit delta [Methanocaldococcus villosus KIN24-T80]